MDLDFSLREIKFSQGLQVYYYENINKNKTKDYYINSNWFDKWKKYIDYDYIKNYCLLYKKYFNSLEDISNFTFDEKYKDNITIPPKINNLEIIVNLNSFLNDGNLENPDNIIINEEKKDNKKLYSCIKEGTWNLLKSEYSYDIEIPYQKNKNKETVIFLKYKDNLQNFYIFFKNRYQLFRKIIKIAKANNLSIMNIPNNIELKNINLFFIMLNDYKNNKNNIKNCKKYPITYTNYYDNLDFYEDIDKYIFYCEFINIEELNNKNNNIIKKPSFERKYSNKGMVGFPNIGNTCYMNCVLQCFNNNKLFIEFILSDKFKINTNNLLGSNGKVLQEIIKLFQKIYQSKNNILSEDLISNMKSLKKEIANVNIIFKDYNQHDALQIFQVLIDIIHEDLNEIDIKPMILDQSLFDSKNDVKTNMIYEIIWENFKARNKSFIFEHFYGTSQTKYHCLKCKSDIFRYELYNILSIPIRIGKNVSSIYNDKYICINIVIIFYELNLNKNPLKFIFYLDTNLKDKYKIKDLYEKIKELFNINIKTFQLFNNQKKELLKLKETIESLENFPIYNILKNYNLLENLKNIDILLFEDKENNNNNTKSLSLLINNKINQLGLEKLIENFNNIKKSNINDLNDNIDIKVKPKEKRTYIYYLSNYNYEEFLYEENINSLKSVYYPRILLTEKEDFKDIYDEIINLYKKELKIDKIKLEKDINDAFNKKDNFENFYNKKSIKFISKNDLSASNLFFQNTFLNNKEDKIKDYQNYYYEQIGEKSLLKKNSNLSFILCLRVIDSSKNEYQIPLPYSSDENLTKMLDLQSILPEDSEYDNKKLEIIWINQEYFKKLSAYYKESIINITNPNEDFKYNLHLNDCFNYYVSTESNKIFCSKCNNDEDVQKISKLYMIPDIFIIHFRRTENNEKDEQFIDFDLNNVSFDKYIENEKFKNRKYELIGIINHTGGYYGENKIYSGHFTSFNKNFTDNNWYMFNDSIIKPISPDKIKTKDAYILIYQNKNIK